MRIASRLGIFALSVVGAFGLAASAGAILGPIDVGETVSHSSMSPVNIPEPTTSVEVDGYTVSLSGDFVVGESALMFDVTFAGESVATDPYLGSAGHLVIIRVDNLGYLQKHSINATGESVRFVAEFPTPGTYRLFFDFSHAGKVRTAAFTVQIAPLSESGNTVTTMADMSHNQEGG